MEPGFHFGWGELAAVLLASAIILVWAALRYGRRRSPPRDDPDG